MSIFINYYIANTYIIAFNGQILKIFSNFIFSLLSISRFAVRQLVFN